MKAVKILEMLNSRLIPNTKDTLMRQWLIILFSVSTLMSFALCLPLIIVLFVSPFFSSELDNAVYPVLNCLFPVGVVGVPIMQCLALIFLITIKIKKATENPMYIIKWIEILFYCIWPIVALDVIGFMLPGPYPDH